MINLKNKTKNKVSFTLYKEQTQIANEYKKVRFTRHNYCKHFPGCYSPKTFRSRDTPAKYCALLTTIICIAAHTLNY